MIPLIIGLTGLTLAPGAAAGGKKKSPEFSLAGLRPGKDKLKSAINRHGPYYRRISPDSEQAVVWIDTYKHRALRVELDGKGVIRSVTISTIDPLIDPDSKPDAPLPSQNVATGKGLRIVHNVYSDVKETYGDPDLSEDTQRNGHSVRILTYNFEKAPQTMEFLCERPGGRIVQITLAVGGS